jgi:hypothetical protein
MKQRAIAIVVALVLVLGLVLERTWHRGGRTPPPPPATHYVRRIASPEERQKIAERIATARATATASSGSSATGSSGPAAPAPPPGAATSAAPPPSLPPGAPPADGELARASVPLRDALTEAIPLLADCYPPEARAKQRATVLMSLVGDDKGTLIDADNLVDENGKSLAPELDDCLRSTLRSMQLPPLAEGGDLHIQYSFRFDD